MLYLQKKFRDLNAILTRKLNWSILNNSMQFILLKVNTIFSVKDLLESNPAHQSHSLR